MNAPTSNKKLTTRKPHKVALIEWTHLIEDFLDNIGLTLEDFKDKMTGGWLFGYIQALKTSGVDTVLFCFSSTINDPLYFVHTPTGADVCILPSTGIYRRLRKVILNPYTQVVEEAAVNTKGWKRRWCSFLLHAAPYCATPLSSFYQQIKKYNCTAILCQDYEHARFDACIVLGKLLKLPVFASFQGGNWQMSYAEKWIRPITIKACKGFIVASGVEAIRLKEKYKLPEEKLKKIFNPVDLSMWEGCSQDKAKESLGINANKRIAIWHGRIDYYRKGLDILIDAWEKICAENGEENFELIILGSGVNAEMLRLRLTQSSLKNVTWINEYINDRKKMYNYLKSADVYVFPSRNEGFPVAPLEAMACGLPLVAADAPGISDILQNGENSGGIMLKREDTNAFASTILCLLQHKEKADTLGSLAAQNIQQNFSIQSVGTQLKQFMFCDENKK